MAKKKIGRAAKVQDVHQVEQLFLNNGCAVVVGQKSMLARDMMKIRSHMAVHGCKMRGVRRASLQIALGNQELSYNHGLEGDNLLICGDEPMAVIAALSACNIKPSSWLNYKFAIVDGKKIVCAEDLKWMSTLPDPSTIKRQFLGTLMSPLGNVALCCAHVNAILPTLIASKLSSVNNT